MNKKWTMALGSALTIALLAGCGSRADDVSSQTAAQTEQAAGDAAQGAAQDGSGGTNGGAGNAAGQGRFGMGMTDENGNIASLIGKVKSVDGQAITVYKSSFDPSSMPAGGRGGMGGGSRPSGAPDASSAPAAGGASSGASGQAAPSADAGQAPAGQASAGSGGQAQGAGGNRQGPGGMANSFTDETEQITVTDATKIESTTFENGQAVTNELTAADLKADDVLTIWLKEGTQEATLIRVGGFGGGRQGRQDSGQPAQGQEQPSAGDQAAAAQS